MFNKFALEFKKMIAMHVRTYKFFGQAFEAPGEGKQRLFDYEHLARDSAVNDRFRLECRI
jgi:hypothetical protein